MISLWRKRAASTQCHFYAQLTNILIFMANLRIFAATNALPFRAFMASELQP
jgi:hypothetical protein